MNPNNSNPVIYIKMSGIDENLEVFSLDDFGGILPMAGDFIKLPIKSEKDKTGEVKKDYFKVVNRYLDPEDRVWTVEVEPCSGMGFMYYYAKLQEQ